MPELTGECGEHLAPMTACSWRSLLGTRVAPGRGLQQEPLGDKDELRVERGGEGGWEEGGRGRRGREIASTQEMRKVQEREEWSGDRERGKNQKTGSEDTGNQRGECGV